MEQWKDIEGYEGLYRVSNYGRIYSAINDKILKTPCGNHGYPRVNLSKGKPKQYLVHRLVAMAFVSGDIATQINHIDGNKRNNSAKNLEWCTGKGNTIHAYHILKRPGSRSGQFGEDDPRSRPYTITYPSGQRENVIGLAEFCRQQGLDNSKMTAVAKGRRNHHKGFKCEPIMATG